MNDRLYKMQRTSADTNALIAEHKNLVYYVLHKLGHAYDADYESVAFEGLWNAIETFDIFGTTAFSTYAVTCITNAVRNEYIRQSHYKKRECDFEIYTSGIDNCDTTYLNPGEYYKNDCATEVEAQVAVSKLRSYIRDYINTMSTNTVAYSMIQLWYASGCEASPTQLAAQLDTTASCVSRALVTCRAYLARRIFLDKKEDK